MGGSRIIIPEHVTADFFIEIMPKINGRTCQNLKLLYQHTAVPEANALSFHAMCDNQGPTLTIVLANDGYIFGGYNPISWLSDFMYTETDESYLFQLVNPGY